MIRKLPPVLAVALVAAFLPNSANAQNIDIQITNNQTTGGFFLTPLWFGVHDGSFDYFDGNNTAAASPGLELLAEEGDASTFMAEFSAAQPSGQQGVILSPGGFAGAPVIDPGETAMTSISVGDPATNQYFSYASMVIPSNDAFIGNDDGMAYQLFDGSGNFNGPLTIEIFGSSVYDGGTEVNDENGGAAFSANGGTSVSESLFVRVHPGLGNFVGTSTVAGTQITSDIGVGELLATITINASAIPEPGSFVVLAMATGGLFMRRRRS